MKTRRSISSLIAVITVAAALTAAVLHAQQARDTSTQPPKGTSLISGRIVTHDSTPQPVRRATVTLIPEGGGVTGAQIRVISTDDAGRFEIRDLPEGRYTLTASKAPFLDVRYGSTRPGGAGTTITLKAGATMTDIVLKMARGAVVTGRILDENGEPAWGVSVRALQVRNQGGERTLVQASAAFMPAIESTDDRGMYRIFGLAPGEYVISATPRSTLGEIRAMTEDEIRAIMTALQEQRAAAAQQSQYGNAMPNPSANKPPAVAPSDASKVTIAYAPVFYPGATTSSMATAVTLGAGEERTGVDVSLRLVRTTTVEGMVVVPEGIAPQNVQLMIQPTGADAGTAMMTIETLMGQRVVPGPDGKFKYTSLAPGQYSSTARATRGSGPVPPPPPPPPPPGAGGGGGAGAQVMTFTARATGGEAPMVFVTDGPAAQADPNAIPYWASVDVTVDGSPINGVALTLQPGMTVSGKVEFRSGVVRPGADFKSIQLNLLPAPGANPVINMGGTQFRIDEKGNFTITGVVPGRYRLNGFLRNPVPQTGPGAGDPWYIGSAMVKGQDVMDVPLTIAPNENLSGAVVTFTDTIQTVEGTLALASGRPAPDFTIVVFSSDKRFWLTNSRRIRSVRPATDGGFRVNGLPPGEYRLAAVTDVRPEELTDSAFLEQLVGASIPITLAPGEKKKQDVKISGGL